MDGLSASHGRRSPGFGSCHGLHSRRLWVVVVGQMETGGCNHSHRLERVQGKRVERPTKTGNDRRASDPSRDHEQHQVRHKDGRDPTGQSSKLSNRCQLMAPFSSQGRMLPKGLFVAEKDQISALAAELDVLDLGPTRWHSQRNDTVNLPGRGPHAPPQPRDLSHPRTGWSFA